jgi:predicted GNAT family N-acyltransferase
VQDIAYRRATLQEILALRSQVLRPNAPPLQFPGDELPSPQTLHFAAFINHHAIACLTFLTTTHNNQPAYQLRGMAVDPQHRNRTIGATLLTLAEETVLRETPIRTLWCNARQPALAFYQRQNWIIISDLFQIESAGPHYKMEKHLSTKP